jgi:hypothetical protein
LNKVTEVTAPKIQIALPDLPVDGRICYYGYDIAVEWLADYSDKHWPYDDNERFDILSKASEAVEVLRRHSGIERLDLESALMDHAAPSNTVIIPGHLPGEIRVTILSIFSNLRAFIVQETAKSGASRPVVGNYWEAAKVVG